MFITELMLTQNQPFLSMCVFIIEKMASGHVMCVQLVMFAVVAVHLTSARSVI